MVNNLEEYLKLRVFKQGIEYSQSIELIVGLFCTTSWLPDLDPDLLTKDNLCDVFARIFSQGLIHDYDAALARERRCVSSPTLSEHWKENIKYAFYLSPMYDKKIVRDLCK